MPLTQEEMHAELEAALNPQKTPTKPPPKKHIILKDTKDGMDMLSHVKAPKGKAPAFPADTGGGMFLADTASDTPQADGPGTGKQQPKKQTTTASSFVALGVACTVAGVVVAALGLAVLRGGGGGGGGGGTEGRV